MLKKQTGYVVRPCQVNHIKLSNLTPYFRVLAVSTLQNVADGVYRMDVHNSVMSIQICTLVLLVHCEAMYTCYHYQEWIRVIMHAYTISGAQ